MQGHLKKQPFCKKSFQLNKMLPGDKLQKNYFETEDHKGTKNLTKDQTYTWVLQTT